MAESDAHNRSSQCYENTLNYAYPERMTDDALVAKLQVHGIDASMLDSAKGDSLQLQHLFYTHLAALPRRVPRDNRRGRKVAQCRLMEPKVKIYSSNKSDVGGKSSSQKHKPTSSSSPMSEMDKLLNRSKVAKVSSLKKENDANANISESDRLFPQNKIRLSGSSQQTEQLLCTGNQESTEPTMSEMDKLEARSKITKLCPKEATNVITSDKKSINIHTPNTMATGLSDTTQSSNTNTVKRKGVIKLKRKFIPLDSKLLTACKINK